MWMLLFLNAVKCELPVYHTHAMRRQFVDMYGKLMKGNSPYLLQVQVQLTPQMKVDKRLHEALENEDP